MGISPALEYIPVVAVVARLADGQMIVLHGQAEEVSTEANYETDQITTTVTWRGEFTQLRIPDSGPGVALTVLDSGGTPRFDAHPMTPTDTDEQVTQP